MSLDTPRLIAIVCPDYGELGHAMYFLQGLALSVPPIVLLPASLQASVGTQTRQLWRTYTQAEELWREIEALRPDAVLLFSGYLLDLPPHSLLKTLRLLYRLRRQGITTLTTDPFLGLLNRPGALDFTQVLQAEGSPMSRALRSWRVSLRLFLLRLALRHCVHLYPAPMERLHGATAAKAGMHSYFNPLPVPAPEEDDGRGIEGPALWLFVLSDIDYRLQLRRRGSNFPLQVLDRLRDAQAQGRIAMLVGPPALTDILRPLLGSQDRITLHTGLDYDRYLHLLLRAEYAFFWNLYSFSLMHRVQAALPVLYFDEGHMVDIMPALHEAGIELFYAGWHPRLLSLDLPLTTTALLPLVQETRHHFVRITQVMGACETSGALLRHLLSADQPGIADA